MNKYNTKLTIKSNLTEIIEGYAYLDMLSHAIGNFMLEPYEAKELIDTFGIDMKSLKKELFEVYDSEDMREWLEALQDEFGDDEAF